MMNFKEWKSYGYCVYFFSSFHLAATKGHVECLRVMVTHGVDVTAQDAAGMWSLSLKSIGRTRVGIPKMIHWGKEAHWKKMKPPMTRLQCGFIICAFASVFILYVVSQLETI